MGSGGASGGGSSSGTIDYPQYMKDQHLAWLNSIAALITNVTEGPSPFAYAVPYDPDSDLAAMWGAVCDLEAAVASLNPLNDFYSMIALATSQIDASFDKPTFIHADPAAETQIAASVAAWSAIHNEQVETETLPKFRAGMRDINAVQSSAFVLGQAYIEAARDRDIAAYQAELRMKAFLLADEIRAKEVFMENDLNYKIEISRRDSIMQTTDRLLTYNIQAHEFKKNVTHYTLETLRMKLIAKKEQFDTTLSIDEMDAKWDLEAYQYGANIMAAIGSGTVSPQQRQQSQGMSALGSGLSGAATGAMVGAQVGGGYGAAIGAGVGFLAGLATSL